MTAKSSDEPSHAERGARMVGELWKIWPAKEAPLMVHIAFCEELQRVLKPYAAGAGSEFNWFGQVQRALGQRLKTFRQLESSVQHEAVQTKRRLEALAEQAPTALQRVLWQVRR